MNGPFDQTSAVFQTRQMGLRVIMDATGVEVLLITKAERVRYFCGDGAPGTILVITASAEHLVGTGSKQTKVGDIIPPGQVIGTDCAIDTATPLIARLDPRNLIDLGPRIAAQIALT